MGVGWCLARACTASMGVDDRLARARVNLGRGLPPCARALTATVAVSAYIFSPPPRRLKQGRFAPLSGTPIVGWGVGTHLYTPSYFIMRDHEAPHYEKKWGTSL